jgi:hypothetical protein
MLYMCGHVAVGLHRSRSRSRSFTSFRVILLMGTSLLVARFLAPCAGSVADVSDSNTADKVTVKRWVYSDCL